MNEFKMTSDFENHMRSETGRDKIKVGDIINITDQEISNLDSDVVYDYLKKILDSNEQKSDPKIKKVLLRLMERGTELLNNE